MIFISRNFQTFDTTAGAKGPDPYGNQYTGSYLDPTNAPPADLYDNPTMAQKTPYTGSTDFDDEPPLLEGNYKINLLLFSLINSIWEKRAKKTFRPHNFYYLFIFPLFSLSRTGNKSRTHSAKSK